MTYSYFKETEIYINDICYPLLLKYTSQAVENGFEDYKISEYTRVNMDEVLSNK